METTLIIQVGRTPIAVVNAIWSILDSGEKITRIIYLCTKETKPLTNKILKAVCELNPCRQEVEEITAEPDQIYLKLSNLIEREKKKGRRVILDITPGRKITSVLMLKAAYEKKADEVYYLLLKNIEYQDEIYSLIPWPAQKLLKVIH